MHKKDFGLGGEREWRILTLANTEQTKADRLFKFNPRDIRRIFVGPRVSGSGLEFIRSAVKASGQYWTVL